ncbi:hypothetical protein [Ideonella paludis]
MKWFIKNHDAIQIILEFSGVRKISVAANFGEQYHAQYCQIRSWVQESKFFEVKAEDLCVTLEFAFFNVRFAPFSLQDSEDLPITL